MGVADNSRGADGGRLSRRRQRARRGRHLASGAGNKRLEHRDQLDIWGGSGRNGHLQHLESDLDYVFIGIFIQRIQFTSTASTFSFALPSTGLGITGAGISISSPDFTPAPIFTVSGDGLLAFANGATASDRPSFSNSNNTGTVIINNDSGRTIFNDSSTAGLALINNNDNTFGGGTTFRNQSTAGSALIANNNSLGGGTTFRDQSNAGNASIFNDEGLTIFQDHSKAASSTIQNISVGATFFTDQELGRFCPDPQRLWGVHAVQQHEHGGHRYDSER